MATGFEVKVRVEASVLAELAENHVDSMELPENYDRSELSARLADDPDFRQAVIDEFTSVFKDIAEDHWSHDIGDRIEDRLSRVGWLAEIQQDINEADEIAEFEDNLIREGRWVLEVESARQMLERLGWTVARPIPKKRKQ